jgi:hypothetical protein
VLVFAALLEAQGVAAADLARLPLTAVWLAAVLSDLLIDGWAYLVLLVLLALSARWERAVIRLMLADEVGQAVTAEEYSSIMRSLPVLGSHAAARQAGRLGERVFMAQAELAFRKWHLRCDGGDPASDPLVAAWRRDIQQLRHQLAGQQPL